MERYRKDFPFSPSSRISFDLISLEESFSLSEKISFRRRYPEFRSFLSAPIETWRSGHAFFFFNPPPR